MTLRLIADSIRHIRNKIWNRVELVDSSSTFETRANETVNLITAWTRYQTTPRLRDLVQEIYRIWTIEKLDELFGCIPDDPRVSLRDVIGRVHRYKEAGDSMRNLFEEP